MVVQNSSEMKATLTHPFHIVASKPLRGGKQWCIASLHRPSHDMCGRQRRNYRNMAFQYALEVMNVKDIREFTAKMRQIQNQESEDKNYSHDRNQLRNTRILARLLLQTRDLTRYV